MPKNTDIISIYKGFLLSERDISKETCKNYTYEIELFLSHIKDTPFEQVNFTEYLKSRTLKSKLSASTIRNIRTILISFYNFLLSEKIVSRNHAEKICSPEKHSKIPYVLHCYDLFKISQQFKTSSETDLRDAAIIETLYSTGLRVSELLSLGVNDHKNGYAVVIGKNNKQRMVIFNSTCRARIELYLKSRSAKSLILFTNLNGTRLSRRYINSVVTKLSASAGIAFKVTPHTFRHTFASHLYEGGANLLEVRDLLGHESITTTEIYTKIDMRHLRKELQLYHPSW